jgi:hypothetical protein
MLGLIACASMLGHLQTQPRPCNTILRRLPFPAFSKPFGALLDSVVAQCLRRLEEARYDPDFRVIPWIDVGSRESMKFDDSSGTGHGIHRLRSNVTCVRRVAWGFQGRKVVAVVQDDCGRWLGVINRSPHSSRQRTSMIVAIFVSSRSRLIRQCGSNNTHATCDCDYMSISSSS